MNKLYDKLLLAVAVLALFTAVGFYLMKFGQTSAAPQLIEPSAANPYQAIPMPALADAGATWPDAQEQAPGERYDVFTPPKIYIDHKGNFIFVSPEVGPAPFDIYLAKFERDPYRIQLEGYIEEDLQDASKSLLLLYDEEQQQSVRARVGQEKAEFEFTLLDFTIERIRDVDGNISKNVFARLLDHRTDKQVVLKHGERLYQDSATIILRSEQDPTVEVLITQTPQAFETSVGNYIAEEINLEAFSVIVTKLGDDQFEPRTKQLTLSPSSTQIVVPESSESISDTDSETGDTFDFLF